MEYGRAYITKLQYPTAFLLLVVIMLSTLLPGSHFDIMNSGQWAPRINMDIG